MSVKTGKDWSSHQLLGRSINGAVLLQYYLALSAIHFRLPRWLSGKGSTCQCRRRGFDPWVGKIPWRRKWQPTPVFLPGESPGQRSLVCWTHKRVGNSLTTTLYIYSTPSNPTRGVHPTEMNEYSQRKVYKNVYNRFIPNSPKAVK